jgi:oligosaccharyltransferase complex subunit gamma
LSSEKTTNASCLNARHCRVQPSYILKMKLVGPLVISLLSCSAFAAKKPAASTFETYHARAVASTPISIDDQGYEQVTSAPRDYSVAVLLTALEDKFGCKLCRDFHPEWSVVAHSWLKGDKKGESRTLFATMDFSRGRATFIKV